MSATLAFYFHGYLKPSGSPSPWASFSQPLQVGQYFLGFLGAPLSFGQLSLAQLVGLGLLVVLSLTLTGLAKIAWQHHANPSPLLGQWWQQAVMPWLTLAAYSLTSAIIAAIGRVGFGVEQALSSRYVTVAIYLEVAVVALLAVLWHWRDGLTDSAMTIGSSSLSATQLQPATTPPPQRSIGSGLASFYRTLSELIFKYRRWLLVFFVTLWLVFQGASYAVGHERLRDFNRHIRLGKACAVLLNVVRDPDCLYQFILPDAKISERFIRRMDRLHLLQPPVLKTPWVDRWGVITKWGQNYGFWDNFARGDQQNYVASGWAALPAEGRSADVVILTAVDRSGGHRALALARVAVHRDDIALRLGQEFDYTGWSVVLRPEQLPVEATTLNAWAFDTLQARAYRLPNTYLWPGRAKAGATVPQAPLQP